MPNINIIVREKIAQAVGDTHIVCGNSDYTAVFDFDAEWDAYETKTARFIWNGKYTDVVFTGTKCPVPVITGAFGVLVGVYAGDLHTTTAATVDTEISILCRNRLPADPPPDVYAQIIAKLNGMASPEWKDIQDKPFTALGDGLSVDKDNKLSVSGKIDAPQTATVGEVLTVEEVDEDGKPVKWKTEKNVSNNDFVVDVIQKNGIWTSSKTILEIYDAYRAGLRVYALIYDNVIIPLNMSGDSYFVFIGFANMNGYNKCTISDYGTGVNVMWSNTVPEVGWDNITDYFLDEQAFLMCVHDNYAPGGGGLMYYKYGKSSVTTGYRLLALDGNSYDVSYDRRYRELTVKKVLSPLFAPTTAQVGQIVKVKAVDDTGKITETEAVDFPKQKSLKWVTVHASTLTEETTEIVVSTDADGKAIADYNPVGLMLIVSTPADATQTDNDGAPWVYPSATKKDNSIRVIGTIAGWKTTARDSVFAFYGGSSAMTCTGNKNAQLATYKIDGYSLDGVTAMLYGNANHFPVGTHVEVSILCEVEQ